MIKKDSVRDAIWIVTFYKTFMRYSFYQYKDLILERLKLIEVNRDDYAISDTYNEKEFEGWIKVTYKGKALVSFHYMVIDAKPQVSRFSCSLKVEKYSKWYQNYLEKGKDVVQIRERLNAHNSNDAQHSIEYVLDKYLPLGKQEDKEKIARSFAAYDINENKIVFDTRLKTYMVELDLTKYFYPTESKQTSQDKVRLYKYMSLDTFLSILNNKTFRLNSIISMNDKYEGEWINHLLYGSKKLDEDAQKVENVKNKNILVTSFTDKEDDGLMWIRYGNNGCGVCMEFVIPVKDVTKVFYIDGKNKDFQNLRNKLISLDQQDIHVSLMSVQKMRYIVKSTTFTTENEYRYLYDANAEQLKVANYNGLLSTYKDFAINTRTGSINGLPFSISEVILGSNIPNYITNIAILTAQTHEVFPSVLIFDSKVNEIR